MSSKGEPSNLTTTIQIDSDFKSDLDKIRKGRESYNALLKRIVSGIGDVYINFHLIDNELPITHTVVFQLGENSQSLYFYDGHEDINPQQFANPITAEEVQKLLKEPRPNMSISVAEARDILECFDEHLLNYKRQVGKGYPESPFAKRLKEFVESHLIEANIRRKKKVQT